MASDLENNGKLTPDPAVPETAPAPEENLDSAVRENQAANNRRRSAEGRPNNQAGERSDKAERSDRAAPRSLPLRRSLLLPPSNRLAKQRAH